MCFFLTLFRMGRGKKTPLSVFLPKLLLTHEIALKTSWRLVLTHLSHWCKIPNPYVVPVTNYWTVTKTTPKKSVFFWSNPYKIEVMITSFVEVLQLPNFGHMTISTIQFESRNNVWWWRHWQKFWRENLNFFVLCFFNLYFSKFLSFKKSYSSHFYWHPKNCNHA